MKNSEPFFDGASLKNELQALKAAVEEFGSEEVRDILERTVEGYAMAQHSLELKPGQPGKWPQGSRFVH